MSGTSLTCTGDQTTTLHIGRRIKTTNTAGTRYSTIIKSVFSALTTVTVANDSGSLDSGLSALSYSISSADNTSVPFISTDQQCGRLVYVSTTQIRLDPQDGNTIWVNTSSAWKRRLIASAGITAANTSVYVNGTAGQNLGADTTYYVYLFDNAGVLTMDFSTAPAVDTTSGLYIKTGVASRLLVGMVRTNSSTPGQFQTPALVLSWYKRRKIAASGSFTVGRTTSSTSLAEINSEIRVKFLNWGDEAVITSYQGFGTNDTSNGGHVHRIGMDPTPTYLAETRAQHPTVNGSVNLALTTVNSPAEGYHYMSIWGAIVNTTTVATWSYAAGVSGQLLVVTQG